ncbi:hypothetical protein WMF27_33930 [Sorangium sp. So ce281]|uniref:hypothetical protein n=1 Tax=unclassified Sorangium TaxID=2621164 RepID=UPI003F624F07
MKLRLKAMAAAAVTVIALGCSIMDPDDRDELRRRIAALPSETLSHLQKTKLNTNALRWLLTYKKDHNDQVGKLQCRLKAGGTWSGWNDQEPTYTVEDLIQCLLGGGNIPVTYTMCADEFQGRGNAAMNLKILHEEQVPGVTQVECRFVWDFRYEPEKVPSDLTNPRSITVDELIDWLISLPAPPPGFAAPQLVPLLCPLGAGPGWGCPPRPTDLPGEQPTDPTGGEPGDHP